MTGHGQVEQAERAPLALTPYARIRDLTGLPEPTTGRIQFDSCEVSNSILYD